MNAAAAAAAAKSLQSCPTLCNPIDGSPLGSSVPGVLVLGKNLIKFLSLRRIGAFWGVSVCACVCFMTQQRVLILKKFYKTM